MAKKLSIAQQLENHISEIEAKIAALQTELSVAKKNFDDYNTHKLVIESILSLKETADPAAPVQKRKYTKRAKPTEAAE